MLDSLLKAEKNGEINDEGIKEQVNTFIFAGHDTVSVTITFTLFVLAQHLDVQERILNEFNETKTNGDFKMTDLIGMQYFDRVIKECQRLYPAVPIIARQLSENFDMSKNFVI
jgi:cytochrome P450